MLTRYDADDPNAYAYLVAKLEPELSSEYASVVEFVHHIIGPSPDDPAGNNTTAEPDHNEP